MMVGGFEQDHAATPEVQELLNHHKEEIAGRLSQSVESIEALTYKSQVVAGTNFLIKAKVNGSLTVTVKIFRPLPHTGAPTQLTEVSH